jgi:hypothetical protein
MQQPIACLITDPDVVRLLNGATRRKGEAAREAYIQSMVNDALRAALGLSVDLSPRQAAMRLGVHVNTIHNYNRAGMFPRLYYLSSRAARIPLRDVEAFKNRTVTVREERQEERWQEAAEAARYRRRARGGMAW